MDLRKASFHAQLLIFKNTYLKHCILEWKQIHANNLPQFYIIGTSRPKELSYLVTQRPKAVAFQAQ